MVYVLIITFRTELARTICVARQAMSSLISKIIVGAIQQAQQLSHHVPVSFIPQRRKPYIPANEASIILHSGWERRRLDYRGVDHRCLDEQLLHSVHCSSRQCHNTCHISPHNRTATSLPSHNSPARNSKRFSSQSLVDVADRVLRDKTDAIAYIIRNISEQCAAAVEGLQLAQRADTEDGDNQSDRRASLGQQSTTDGRTQSTIGSEYGDEDMLRPGRGSSIPPTPDLTHRSSTSMSMASASTTPDRTSLQHRTHDVPDVPTRIVEDEAFEDNNSYSDLPVSKYATPLPRSRQSSRQHAR